MNRLLLYISVGVFLSSVLSLSVYAEPANKSVDLDNLDSVKFTKAAQNGDPNAMFNLGVMYQNGWTVEQNYESSIGWYDKAAQNGNTRAMINLGWIYKKGLAGEINEEKAIEWFQMAAASGNVNAMYILGFAYETGYGVEIDKTHAVQWYRQGADVQRLLPLLSTYLGHIHIAATQQYLTMTSELLHQASIRFENYAWPKEVHHD